MVNLHEPVLLAYGVLYILALALAIYRRKTFPLGDSLGVMLIVGIGFTGVVFLIVPQFPIPLLSYAIQPTELAFVLVYLVLVALFLSRKKPPAAKLDGFIKKQLRSVGIKLLVFVFIPLLVLRLFWKIKWSELGFSQGNLPGQLLLALALILLFGGFNLLAGSAAAPIRARQFNAKQLSLGYGLAFGWNIVETGLVEEFFFRAFLQTSLVNYLHSPISGIAATSLLFGLAHAPGIYLRGGDKSGPLGEHPSLLNSILYSILVLSPAGWFTGLLFWRTQSLIAPILVHAGVDAVASTAEFIREIGFLKKLGKGADAVRG
jgi:membrane protease YdiL (CAAX protease family)